LREFTALGGSTFVLVEASVFGLAYESVGADLKERVAEDAAFLLFQPA
jgi:hypothetical protein